MSLLDQTRFDKRQMWETTNLMQRKCLQIILLLRRTMITEVFLPLFRRKLLAKAKSRA
jgi:hypothetical protein